MTRRRTSPRAFSLIESSIASVVLGVLVVGALQSLGAIGRARAFQSERAIADGLVQSLAVEIRGQPYEDPTATTSTLGPDGDDSGTGRSGWDDVDDYAGLKETPPLTRAGAAVRSGDWVRQTTVEWVTVDPVSAKITVAAAETGVKRITINVTSNSRPVASMTFLRTRAWDEVEP